MINDMKNNVGVETNDRAQIKKIAQNTTKIYIIQNKTWNPQKSNGTNKKY